MRGTRRSVFLRLWPALFGYKHGDTDYKVCLLPLGGFVRWPARLQRTERRRRRHGHRGAEDDPGALTSHPRWQQMLIGLAGPVANFVLAFVLMVFYFGWINEVPADEVKSTTVEWVTPGSAAAQAGIESGDILATLQMQTIPIGKRSTNAQAEREPDRSRYSGARRQDPAIELPCARRAKNDDFDPSDTGLLPQFLTGPIGVQEVSLEYRPSRPVCGRRRHPVRGWSPLPYRYSLLAYMQDGKGKPLTLVIVRNGVP